MNVYVYGKYFYAFIISTVIQSVVLAVNGKIILLTGMNYKYLKLMNFYDRNIG